VAHFPASQTSGREVQTRDNSNPARRPRGNARSRMQVFAIRLISACKMGLVMNRVPPLTLARSRESGESWLNKNGWRIAIGNRLMDFRARGPSIDSRHTDIHENQIVRSFSILHRVRFSKGQLDSAGYGSAGDGTIVDKGTTRSAAQVRI
jgi:hypothetical protein